MKNLQFQQLIDDSNFQAQQILFESKKIKKSNKIIVKEIEKNDKNENNWYKILLLNNKYYFAIGFNDNSNFIQFLSDGNYDSNNENNKVEYSWLSDLGPFKKQLNSVLPNHLKNALNPIYIYLFENFEEFDIFDYEDED